MARLLEPEPVMWTGRSTIVWGSVASSLLGLLLSAPVRATNCSYYYDDNDFPRWSESCSTVMAPGRFGLLRMGDTSVRRARQLDYLAENPMCGGRIDGMVAYDNWRRKNGKVVAWSGRRSPGGSALRTSKGLQPEDSLRRARALYPGLTRTGFLRNPYVPGQGWRIYSVRGKGGWLDLYRYEAHKQYSFFAVRASTVRKPITDWSLDGC